VGDGFIATGSAPTDTAAGRTVREAEAVASGNADAAASAGI
jgi:hypothetical protein